MDPFGYPDDGLDALVSLIILLLSSRIYIPRIYPCPIDKTLLVCRDEAKEVE